MAELWELILHHSYTGTPGVVFDRSPRGAVTELPPTFPTTPSCVTGHPTVRVPS